MDLHGGTQRGRRPAAAEQPPGDGVRAPRPRVAGERAVRAGRAVGRRMAHPPRAREAHHARARGDRAGVLERAFPERGGELSRPAARDGEDADAERPCPARRGAGRRNAMTTFDELVGGEPTGDERARLRNVHELLVEAGPPPEIPPEIASGPTLVMTLGRVRRARSRSRRMLIPALAAAALAALV